MRAVAAAIGLLVFASGQPALAGSAACHMGKYLGFDVLLTGERPMVTTKISGKDAAFIVDSGAFYSTMSRATAAEYGLRTEPAPSGLRLRGVNGDTSLAIASVHDFIIGGVALPKVDFLVGGSDTGAVGLLGQNFLGIGDVEYDLPHGAIRLLKAHDCPVGSLAYWAGGKPVAALPLEYRQPPFQTHTIGTVTLNGVRLRAIFDTGAEATILTLSAAKRAGITPESPDVVEVENSTGLGTRSIRTWMGNFGKLDIGGEAIGHARLRFGNIQLDNGDMLIGLDFFRTHRVYVSNTANMMLLTYEGGPVFGMVPRRAVTNDGAVVDLTDKAAAPTTADAFSRRGAVFASNNKLEEALADFDKAVLLAPGEASYLRLRASARLANHQPLLAAADIDKAVALDPAEPQARIMRAGLRLGARDFTGAHEDMIAADKVLPPSSDRRLLLGSMLNITDDYEAALTNFEAWLKAHPEDANRPSGLNGRCWTRALLNRDLDRALDDCNTAVRMRPTDAAYLDSRALVRLRRGELAKALGDYDAAIRLSPQTAWSIYARSVVRKRMGDTSGAAADRAAAVALQPEVVDRGRKYKLDD